MTLDNHIEKILDSNQWGTIAPYAVSVSEALASFVGAPYGFLTSNADSAYESFLRHFGVGHGDIVLVPAVCAPMDALLPVCVGAMPVFYDSTAALEKLLTMKTLRCVVADYVDGSDIAAISAICKAKNVPLIVNAGGDFTARVNAKPLTDYADGVVYTLDEGSTLSVGSGGFGTSANVTVHTGFYAFHNCGRPFGAGSSLNMDEIVGGDSRVSEWIAATAGYLLEAKQLTPAKPIQQVKMAGQPVFESAYAKKMTGK